MSDKANVAKDGGAAFPVLHESSGMSLRAYMAGQALSIMADPSYNGDAICTAKTVVGIADAVLAELAATDKANVAEDGGEAIVAAYERFKHLDRVFEMVGDPDGTDNTDPFHAAARDLWRAVKTYVGASHA